MIRTIRRPVAFVAVLLTSFVLAACGSGPSKADSAAIVGQRGIGLDEVQAEIRWLLDNVDQVQRAQEQRKVAQVSRQVVGRRVTHELVRVAADRAGISADSAEVDRIIRRNGGIGKLAGRLFAEPDRVRQVVRDQLLLQELGQHYTDRLSVGFVGTVVTKAGPEASTRELARDLGQRIAADPARAQQTIRDSGHQVLSEELSLKQALQRGPGLATSSVFGVDQGTVVMTQLSGRQAGWLVALVRDRTVSPAGGAESARSAQPVSPKALYSAGVRQLQPIAEDLGVRLNPRYGVWDSAGMTPAPRPEELTGYQLESRTVRP